MICSQIIYTIRCNLNGLTTFQILKNLKSIFNITYNYQHLLNICNSLVESSILIKQKNKYGLITYNII